MKAISLDVYVKFSDILVSHSLFKKTKWDESLAKQNKQDDSEMFFFSTLFWVDLVNVVCYFLYIQLKEIHDEKKTVWIW